jgi:hypothetical protein
MVYDQIDLRSDRPITRRTPNLGAQREKQKKKRKRKRRMRRSS